MNAYKKYRKETLKVFQEIASFIAVHFKRHVVRSAAG